MNPQQLPSTSRPRTTRSVVATMVAAALTLLAVGTSTAAAATYPGMAVDTTTARPTVGTYDATDRPTITWTGRASAKATRPLTTRRRVAIRRAQRAALADLRSVGQGPSTTIYQRVGTSLNGQTSNKFCQAIADAATSLAGAQVDAVDADNMDLATALGKTETAVLDYGRARGCVFTGAGG